MTFKELTLKLKSLEKKGFIPSIRRGPTGIGHLLENQLGIRETNLAIPDIGGRVEIKGTRRNANALITLFTFNRGVWRIKQNDVISKFGYIDNSERKSLYSTVSSETPNSQGFKIEIDVDRNLIILKNVSEKETIAEWSTYVIAGKFMTKLDRLLLIYADSKIENETELFWFNEAYLLEQPTPENFLESFRRNEIFLDIRMHLKKSGGVRNHGTGFRIAEKNLINLYKRKKRII
ncbi:MAG: hypothetical protein HZC46_08680 [Ignavibacterium album]|jgi:hypothetical protein|uniref:MvaI/BcnI family restriction endonuclease n=1 Tax=Ignavibacterium album TaxID=591197 RepID=UPI0026F0CCD7|nr:MvaI/BcnI family restriction endonuclease [Ignavibacterium album]MBI5662208.1 hypothetical protein [Ignavibacterium album]